MITILTNSVNNEEKLELRHKSISSLPNFLDLCLIGATSIVFISVCLMNYFCQEDFKFHLFQGCERNTLSLLSFF